MIDDGCNLGTPTVRQYVIRAEQYGRLVVRRYVLALGEHLVDVDITDPATGHRLYCEHCRRPHPVMFRDTCEGEDADPGAWLCADCLSAAHHPRDEYSEQNFRDPAPENTTDPGY